MRRARWRPAARGRGADRPVHWRVRHQRHPGGTRSAQPRPDGGAAHRHGAAGCGHGILANQAMNYLTTGTAPNGWGMLIRTSCLIRTFLRRMATSSSPWDDGQFRKFAEVAGQPQWADDPRFATTDAGGEPRGVDSAYPSGNGFQDYDRVGAATGAGGRAVRADQ